MDVDAITAPLLNATLRAWRAADPLPPDLLALDILRDPTAASPTERGIRPVSYTHLDVYKRQLVYRHAPPRRFAAAVWTSAVLGHRVCLLVDVSTSWLHWQPLASHD